MPSKTINVTPIAPPPLVLVVLFAVLTMKFAVHDFAESITTEPVAHSDACVPVHPTKLEPLFAKAEIDTA